MANAGYTQMTGGAGSLDSKSYEAKSDTSGMSKDEKILQEAKERFRQCTDYNSTQRAEAVEDLQFFLGNQWNSLILRERTEDRRPALTINKLPIYVQQVVNDIRQNRPTIKIRPMDNATDIQTADVINGMVRYIQNSNDVKAAIDTALEYCVTCGQGYFRIYTDYCDPESFDQEIIIEPIDNPMSVYFPIPLCKAPDYSDTPYCFIRTSMSKDEFKKKYGEKAFDEIQNWQAKGIGDTNWTTEDMVWLAEYFCVEEESKTLYQLSDGSTTFEKPEDGAILLEGLTVVKERQTITRKVIWRLMSEGTILEEEEFPSRYIPVIPVLGWCVNLDGQKTYLSLIRFAKDPQRLYNYFKSMEAETLALAPKIPWLVAAGQIENFENDWKVANVKNLAYLEYNPISSQGQAVPPPQRLDPPAIPAAAVNAMREASDDIKATTGIFDASLGAQGNEKSGKAIIARQRQGDTASYHYVDNLQRAVRQMGRIIVDLIPKIYDTPRVVRILGEDMTQEVMMVNQLHHDEKSGEDRIYDVTVGKYDVTVDVGPSYETKRIETAENLTNIIQAVPTIGQFTSDILVRSLDFPGAQELADRLKRTIPPQILEDPNANPNKIGEADIRMIVQDLEALQQQLQMSQAEKNEMANMIKALQEQLKDRTQEQQIKADAAVIRADAQIQSSKMKLQHEAMKMKNQADQHSIDAALNLSRSFREPAPDYNAEEQQ